MARQRCAVPLEQADRFWFGHPRSEAGQQPPDAVRGLARGVLQYGELLDLVDDSQTVGWVDQEIGGILDGAVRAGEASQLVDEIGRRVGHRGQGVRLPADDTDPAARSDALAGEDFPELPGPVPRLARQAEVLEEVAPHRQGRRAGHPEALVADEDRGLLPVADHEQGFLEPWVEPGQVGEVCAVFAVGVDDESVVATRLDPPPQPGEPCWVEGGWELRSRPWL